MATKALLDQLPLPRAYRPRASRGRSFTPPAAVCQVKAFREFHPPVRLAPLEDFIL